MGCVVSIASGVRESVSEETAHAMLSRAMQQTKIQPKSQKCLWRGKPHWQLSSEDVCRAHWAQVLPVVLIRNLPYRLSGTYSTRVLHRQTEMQVG